MGDFHQRINQSATAEQFEKDLRFFQLLLLLVNKSCPIKNVDLVWTDTEPEARSGLSRTTGTIQALQNPCGRLLASDGTNPTPRFCDLVSNSGRDFCCARSDKAAELRVKQTGHSDVYRCHAGLVDIAVPVICDGRHIATLYSGQVRAATIGATNFDHLQAAVRGLSHVNLDQLRAAYDEVPIVSEQDIGQTVGILEIFADYLATAWKRLHDALEAQQRRLQNAQLDRKEMAHLILDGGAPENRSFRDLSRAVGFGRYPNRVLVVRTDEEDGTCASAGSFEVAFTRTQYAIDSVCSKVENVMSAYLRDRGICIFMSDSERSGDACDMTAYGLAQRILNATSGVCEFPMRVGIGRAKQDWQHLGESYQEAVMALAETKSPVAVYTREPAAVRELSAQVAVVCQALSERRLRDAHTAIRAVPIFTNRHLGEKPEALPAQRQFLISALESVMMTAEKMGVSGDTLSALRRQGSERLSLVGTRFALQESWVASADSVVTTLAHLYSGKHEKLIARAQSIISHRIGANAAGSDVTLDAIACTLGVSAGHLSRTFKKITGNTFERYLMLARVERARRLLLDPLSRVSDVAEKCNFCNPAYFARVFRKIAGCSPTEYSKDPLQMGARSGWPIPVSRH